MKPVGFILLIFILSVCSQNAYCQNWKQYADSAAILSAQNQTKDAIGLYKKAKGELPADSLYSNTYILISNELAKEYINAYSLDSAEVLIDTIIKQVKKRNLEKMPVYLGSIFILGRIYFYEEKYDEAIQLLLSVKNKMVQYIGKESPEYASCTNLLGALYSSINQYDNALFYFSEAAEIRKLIYGNDNILYNTTLMNLGIVYTTLGEYAKAEDLLQKAEINIYQSTGENSRDYINVCNNLANLYKVKGNLDLSVNYLLKAHKIIQSLLGIDNEDYASNCQNMANLYNELGRFSEAEQLYIESLGLTSKISGKNSLSYLWTCGNLATLYEKIGRFAEAENLYLNILQSSNIPPMVYAQNCMNIGNLYSKMALYKNAESRLVEAKSIYLKIFGKDHDDFALCNINLSLLYIQMQEYEKAKIIAKESYQLLKKKKSSPNIYLAMNCYNLAEIYDAENENEIALRFYNEASQIFEKISGKYSVHYAIIIGRIGDCYFKLGQMDKALTALTESDHLFSQILESDHPDLSQCIMSLATLNSSLGRNEEAQKNYLRVIKGAESYTKKVFVFTSEVEKQAYLNSISDVKDNYLSFIISTSYAGAGFSYDISLSNRNLILSSSQNLKNSIYNHSDTSIQNKYDTWIDAREQLAFWHAKPIAERPEYVDSLEDHANTLEKELNRLSAVFQQNQQQTNITWQTIQQNLKPNEAAIEFVKFNYYNGKRMTDSIYYVALLLKNEGEPQLISLFEKKQLDHLLNAGTSSRTINALYTNDQKGDSAYQLIWAPIETHLNGINKIYFAPAGLLYRISFGALTMSANQVLSDKYQLIQLNTTAAVTDESANFITTTDVIDLYGGIRYDVDSNVLKQTTSTYQSFAVNNRSLPDDLVRGNSWQYLPGTATEIDEIEKLGIKEKYVIMSTSGIAATEESMKALSNHSSPAVLHIATHGFFFPDPKKSTQSVNQHMFGSGEVFRQSDNPLFRSGLLFAGANNAWNGNPVDGVEDGILTAYEVSNLYLPNTKIVVLSACETGLGDIKGNEGVYGLQRAFKIAGAQNLVMSLWKVPDQATTEFMTAFYEDLFNHQSINDAYYHAQTVLKKKYRSDPYKWAAWVLVR
ncbi:MAG: CHAT domain-containing tetratricopeptide repeat protein [Chitinophagales bacterium]